MKKLVALLLGVMLVMTMTAGLAESAEKNITVIIKGMGNAYWSILQAGAEKAGQDLNCNVTVQGIPNEVDIEVQLGLLQNAVSAKADAIVIAVADSKAEASAVSEAFQSGIPIVMIDTKAATEDYNVALLTNNVEAGRLAAAQLIEKLKNKVAEDEPAEIAMQIGSAGSQTIILRMEGFEAYWKENAPESWVLLSDDVKVNDGDISKAIQFGHDFLTAYPNLKGFFSPNNGSTVGFATALKEANRTDITMVGFDFSPEMQEIVRDENFNVATMLQRQYLMGYDGVRLALELANGGEVAEKDIDTGVLAVDFANVDSDEVKAVAGIN